MDFRRGDSSKTKLLFKGSHAKVGIDKSYNTAKEGSSAAFIRKESKGRDKRKEFNPKTSALCDGPHWARECSKMKTLNAMIERETEQEGDAQMG